jgi:hypothetical protein
MMVKKRELGLESGLRVADGIRRNIKVRISRSCEEINGFSFIV